MKKFPPQEFEYFLFHEGMGESLAFFFWLKEYRKNSAKKILLFCFDVLRHELFTHSPYVEAVAKIPTFMFDYISIYHAEKFNIRRVLQAHFSEFESRNSRRYAFYAIPDLMRDFLKINPGIKFETFPVQIPQENLNNARKIFEEMNLKIGKTILLVAEGNYYSGLEHQKNFWIKFADRMKSAGYEVVTNSAEQILPNCKNIFKGLFDTTAFVSLCGNIISVPTGFIETLCALNNFGKTKWQIIFPNENDIYWRGRKTDVDKMIAGYEKYLKIIFDDKIDWQIYKWGNSEEEDEILIAKLLLKFAL